MNRALTCARRSYFSTILQTYKQHGDQEVFSVDEMIKLFSLDAIGQSASAFNTEKLVWLNQHYIKSLPAEEVAKHAKWHFDQDPSCWAESCIRRAHGLCKDWGATGKSMHLQEQYPDLLGAEENASRTKEGQTAAVTSCSGDKDSQKESSSVGGASSTGQNAAGVSGTSRLAHKSTSIRAVNRYDAKSAELHYRVAHFMSEEESSNFDAQHSAAFHTPNLQ